jgi:hypothetical protein
VRVRDTLLAFPLACLALLGCDAFGDVERPGEGTGGAGNAGGAASASGVSAGTGAKTSSATGLVGAGAAGNCAFGEESTDCTTCVKQLCCATVDPAQQIEPAATDALAACLDGGGCTCVNQQNECFSDYQEAAGSSSAIALLACIGTVCGQACDCCDD